MVVLSRLKTEIHWYFVFLKVIVNTYKNGIYCYQSTGSNP